MSIYCLFLTINQQSRNKSDYIGIGEPELKYHDYAEHSIELSNQNLTANPINVYS